ncbi:hypothetical protein E6R18_32950 [Streptomyces sp. A1277]|uniref:hypothetical protein n=1 Tax=Streptomyces sp. A1277 TaxID=2563103 RepID=UPI0010A23AA6|nr:hypothetical protein [Streptomyces sp. A1277]THA22757.1 hypothetical protein E6R18_32950 [Streptomyces sp. A1277]
MTEQTNPFMVRADQLTQITATNVTAATITIPGESGPLVTIHPDGRLEYGPGYDPDKAARTFWEAMGRHATPEKQFGRPLARAIDAELARGREAEATVEALRERLPVLRRAVETLPAKCMYHDETHPHGSWREACCDSGVPARRRALAEEALNALTKEKTA